MQQQPGAPSTSGSGGTRTELAAQGQQQTQQLLATCHQLLEACSSSGTGADGARTTELQEQYLAVAAALRSTLAQCRQLEQAEAAAAEQAAASGQGDPDGDPEVAALRTSAADLRSRLEERNQLIKAAIDRLRALLDALAMWDSGRRELAAAGG